MRQDPPFDIAYITATHLLERLAPETMVVNDPVAVRNAPEKLFVLDYADLMPETLITRSLEEAMAFRARHGAVVVKPLHGNAGAAVFKIGRRGRQPAFARRTVRPRLARAVHRPALSGARVRGR